MTYLRPPAPVERSEQWERDQANEALYQAAIVAERLSGAPVWMPLPNGGFVLVVGPPEAEGVRALLRAVEALVKGE